MSRKDYVKAVGVIKKYIPHSNERHLAILMFAELFRGDNPLFNEQKFVRACMEET